MRKKLINNAIVQLPRIIKYGQADIGLQSMVESVVKTSTMSAIQILKKVAFQNKIISLSANQIGLEQRVFVSLRNEYIKNGKWRNYQDLFTHQKLTPQLGYEAVINPVQISSTDDQYYQFQQCPSFPGIKFRIKVPLCTRIKYISQKSFAQNINKLAQKNNVYTIPQNLHTFQNLLGFKARVWDHEIRHLNGFLPILQKICEGNFYLLNQCKSQIQNIDYYQQLKSVQETFTQANLKKMKIQQSEKAKKGNYANQGFQNVSQYFSKVNSTKKIMKPIQKGQKNNKKKK